MLYTLNLYFFYFYGIIQLDINVRCDKMHKVKCRVCGQFFDADAEEYIMPSKNFYYHIKCYNDWRNIDFSEDDEWIDRIYDFIAHDLKKSYDYHKCETQRKKFLKDNKFTNKGMYFALKYFYEIKNNDWEKGYKGIGIIPYIYNESTNFWINQEIENNGIIKRIEENAKNRVRDEDLKIIFKEKNKLNNNKWDLSNI